MRVVISLDYEVFFGRDTGTIERCLIAPTDALLELAGRHGAKLVFFVDAGYLLRLRAEAARSQRLRAEHDRVCRQLEGVARGGHEIQLHVHPHWEDARWTPEGWRIDLSRYALQAFAPAEIRSIVRRQAEALGELAGEAPFAYRAGGWVIQPFGPIRDALLEAGVTIDSSVFRGGVRRGEVQPYDFRDAPRASRWRFDRDPLVPAPDGPFLEVPIASRRVGPLFFWRLAAARKAGGARHRSFGDGRAIAMDGGDLAARLLRPSVSVVSIDGYKASFLARAAEEARARGDEDFVVIGHPKALTPYSLAKLDEFLRAIARRRLDAATFASYRGSPGAPDRGRQSQRRAA